MSVKVNFKNGFLDNNFFHKYQQISLILNSLTMFEELDEVFDAGTDYFDVEYDEIVDKHVILHYSEQYNEIRPICYVDKNDFNMEIFHGAFIHTLKMAWAEHLI